VIYCTVVRTCGQCSVNYPDAVEFCPRDGQKLPPVPGDTKALYDPLIGTTIDGRYIVEALLGEGGMGFVYAARHAIIDKRVAIKVLRKDAAQDEAAAQRFIIEAKAASKIGHQNIVDITDFGMLSVSNGSSAYFVMEFIDGPTLGKLVHEHKQLPPLRAIGITIQIARGLSAAHLKSIIHRDLKPENVFVIEKDGVPDVIKIVDFGIAKDIKAGKRLTAIGMVLGTPEYMSPEQATGQETDHRVDMYALGCILYEMLTGDVPFKGENAPKTLTKHVFEAVVPPSQKRPDLEIPRVLEKIVLCMLQKKPGDRYADMRELIGALEAADRELRAGQQPRTTRRAAELVGVDILPRSKAPLLAGAIVGVGAIVGIIVAAVVHRRPDAAVRVAAPAAVAAAATATAPGNAAAANSDEVQIQVTTVPAGAEVMMGNERLGLSPVDVKRPRANERVTFLVRRAGYKDSARAVMLDRDQVLELTLAPKPVRNGRPTSGREGKSGQSQPKEKHTSDLRNPFE
jgi:tRNA A-37 threonylcarbamoyl transferase component Bud32